MSVGSIDLVRVPVIANEYNAPKIKVNKQGQITYIEDLNADGQLDDLQAVYDEYEAEYEALLQGQTDIQTDIDDGNALITTNDTILDTQEGIMTQDTTDLNDLIDSFVPFEYQEYNVMSNLLTTDSFIFSNTDGNTSEQTAQNIFQDISVPAGSYLVSGFLNAQVIGGDVSKVINSGSGMILNVVNTANGDVLCRFCSGRTGSAFGEAAFSRGQVSGQQYITLSTTTTIGLTFYCFAGAIVGQPSYENFALEWQVQPFATIGSGDTGEAPGNTPPTEYYKAVSFQKI